MTAGNILSAIKYLGDSGDSFLDIENYEKYRFSQEKIDCHHKREITEGKTAQQLIEEGHYVNVPAEDLIFLTHREHVALHMKGEKNPNFGTCGTMFGKHHSDKTKRKIAESLKGKPLSEETKRKIAETLKGTHHSAETKRKLSEAKKGKTHSEESKRKMSESHRGLHWYNNGTKNIRAKVCPAGFNPGRI